MFKCLKNGSERLRKEQLLRRSYLRPQFLVLLLSGLCYEGIKFLIGLVDILKFNHFYVKHSFCCT